jgi:hypothetical protein
MRSLGDADILAVWEIAHRYHPVDQALALLMTAEPGHTRDELAALPLGQRDARLLALRQVLFGDTVNSCGICPRCHETMEFEIDCGALRTPEAGAHERTLHAEGHQLRVRPLSSFDLAAAAGSTDVAAARRILLQCCVVEAPCNNETVTVDALPETLHAAIAQAALAADPQAELLFDLICPACEHGWQATLDIAHILWREVAARAQRLLMEVHLLARAYSWRESDILAMSPARRNAYLQQVAS